jgi:hypothetical protein
VGEGGEEYQLYTLSGASRADFENFGHPRPTAVFAPTFRGEGIIRSDNIQADPRYAWAWDCPSSNGLWSCTAEAFTQPAVATTAERSSGS